MGKEHWVALATQARIGGRTLTRLLTYFGTLEAILEASEDELQTIPHIGVQTARAITSIDLHSTEIELEGLTQQNIQILTWEDAAYPANLLGVPNAPPILFCRGELLPDDDRAVAVVGTRNPSPENEELAFTLAYELAARGWTIVSGLAIGIDTAAHRGAVEAGGRSLAVLGSGVRAIYPRRNAPLAEAIANNGAILSETPPDADVNRQKLIARNRITSGLSRVVFVLQSRADSGSMNTARHAARQQRPIWFTPGSDTSAELADADVRLLSTSNQDWDQLSDALDRITIKPLLNTDSDHTQPRLF